MYPSLARTTRRQRRLEIRRAVRVHRFVAVVAVAVITAVGLVSVAVSTLTPAGAVPYQDWPTFLQNVGRTGATTDPGLSVANSSLLKLKWTFAAGGPIM